MKKYEVIIDMANDFLAFWPSYYTYKEPNSSNTGSQSRLPTKIVATEVEKYITSQKMIKKSSIEDMTDFLQMPNKLSNKIKRQINKNRLKVSIRETSSRKAIISSLDRFDKKELPVPILAKKRLEPKVEDIDIAIISIDAYCATYCLKKVQVFAILINDLQYQEEKEAKAEIDAKSIVFQKHHNFLDVFLKKDLSTLPPHQKHDHKIYLEEEQKPDYELLYKMSSQELDIIKQYFDSHLVKGFIQASSVSSSLLVLFMKK